MADSYLEFAKLKDDLRKDIGSMPFRMENTMAKDTAEVGKKYAWGTEVRYGKALSGYGKDA